MFAILTKPSILDFSAPFAISGLSIKTEQVFDPMIKPQALPGVLFPFLIARCIVEVEANKTKGKMSDSETPRQVEYGYEDSPL